VWCPVIASNASSLPEVVGEAALLVDPYDVEALAQAMLTVLEDDDLKREMSRKGVAQARKFSWTRPVRNCWRFAMKWQKKRVKPRLKSEIVCL